MDVVAALSLEEEWTEELYRNGLTFGRTVADFTKDVGTVIFFAPLPIYVRGCDSVRTFSAR